MATKKETVVEETKIETPEVVENTIDYKSEYEKLKNEFGDLKAMMAQLIESQKTNSVKENVEDKSIKDLNDTVIDDAVIIPTNKMVYLTNLFDGKMYLTGSNNKPVNFENFGVTLPVTYEDLQYICSNHRSFAEKGYFFIHNKDMVHALYLDEAYKKIVNKSVIETILKLSAKQIEEIMNNTTSTIKDTIFNTVVNGVKNVSPEYSDTTKIGLVGKLYGKDIFETAQKLRELEK